ncbi:hypothetical protein IBZ91_13180 [Escherichia coli]|nr:hypothetical protein IBZ91_13180 [Escherichia coli]RTY20686.1 hypothetical protein EKS41_18960 [Shigella sonnei]HEC1984314.1 hypothetical protein [Escherichia coli]HEC2000216.1 hypothetical protein [Escherichia coli]HEC2042548.1 hypothetical protein [Escherichia coli]
MTRTDLHRCYSPISFTVIRTHCRKISVRQYYLKRVIFYPTTLQRTACKKCLFLMRDIIISS